MKLTVTMFVSMDGVLQAPGGPEEDPTGGFDLGGWLIPFADQDMGATVVGWVADADAFLLGRKSYDLLSAHWPRVTDPADPMATALNTLPKYVPSTTARELTWHNSHLLTGDLIEEVRALKAKPGRTLQVHGSGALARELLAAGLVDELRLLTFPVVLGKGRRLFEDGTAAAAWRLDSATSTAAGAIAQVYTYIGAPMVGTVLVDEDGSEAVELVGQ
ncbi:dihydrofolate reductase family protein [Nocardia concava]|uniref:dihydrofolate reductase family protein n=1 Tax=Nocardia concava TaxID=257281 RepID=UPI0002D592B2|nr:dihydrofolate reductase family protein [Nocardia concava]